MTPASNTPSRLDYLAEQLEGMNGADPEADHSRADALLIEALRTFQRPGGYHINQIDRLIAAYEDVRKWYA